jgi:hypothetical protein
MLVDYAYPTTQAEKQLKLLHYAMLEQRPAKALEHLNETHRQLNDIREAVEQAISAKTQRD